MNNNFDDLEFINLEDFDDDNTVSSPGTTNEVDYNALINADVSPDNIDMTFVDKSFAKADEEEENFIARSFELSSEDDESDTFSGFDNDDDEVAANEARRRRRAARERAEKKRRRRKKMLIRRAIFLTAVIAFIVSGVLLVKSLFDYAQGEKIYEAVQEQIFTPSTPSNPKPSNNDKEEPTKEITSPEDVLLENYDHAALLNLNADAVGYLQIPAINVVLPVVHGDDNDYYLTHTLTGESNKSGTLFIDYRDNAGIESKNTIIYGHDMKNGSMFGQLDKFMDKEFFATGFNKYFYFYIEDKIYKYEVYSVHTTPAIGETYSIIFPTDNSFIGYYNNMVKMSYHKTNVPFTAQSNTMTLSTCTNDPNTRLVVQAVRIDTLTQ